MAKIPLAQRRQKPVPEIRDIQAANQGWGALKSRIEERVAAGTPTKFPDNKNSPSNNYANFELLKPNRPISGHYLTRGLDANSNDLPEEDQVTQNLTNDRANSDLLSTTSESQDNMDQDEDYGVRGRDPAPRPEPGKAKRASHKKKRGSKSPSSTTLKSRRKRARRVSQDDYGEASPGKKKRATARVKKTPRPSKYDLTPEDLAITRRSTATPQSMASENSTQGFASNNDFGDINPELYHRTMDEFEDYMNGQELDAFENMPSFPNEPSNSQAEANDLPQTQNMFSQPSPMLQPPQMTMQQGNMFGQQNTFMQPYGYMQQGYGQQNFPPNNPYSMTPATATPYQQGFYQAMFPQNQYAVNALNALPHLAYGTTGGMYQGQMLNNSGLGNLGSMNSSSMNLGSMIPGSMITGSMNPSFETYTFQTPGLGGTVTPTPQVVIHPPSPGTIAFNRMTADLDAGNVPVGYNELVTGDGFQNPSGTNYQDFALYDQGDEGLAQDFGASLQGLPQQTQSQYGFNQQTQMPFGNTDYNFPNLPQFDGNCMPQGIVDFGLGNLQGANAGYRAPFVEDDIDGLHDPSAAQKGGAQAPKPNFFDGSFGVGEQFAAFKTSPDDSAFKLSDFRVQGEQAEPTTDFGKLINPSNAPALQEALDNFVPQGKKCWDNKNPLITIFNLQLELAKACQEGNKWKAPRGYKLTVVPFPRGQPGDPVPEHQLPPMFGQWLCEQALWIYQTRYRRQLTYKRKKKAESLKDIRVKFNDIFGYSLGDQQLHNLFVSAEHSSFANFVGLDPDSEWLYLDPEVGTLVRLHDLPEYNDLDQAQRAYCWLKEEDMEWCRDTQEVLDNNRLNRL
ncbi:hypothetical protein EG329_000918 [Mollisiaceae sp. DMI_Dod_QoI]|nr:hypothetical protein EG329_000918 [Helotiales sp. DMI_Dod_QoI]